MRFVLWYVLALFWASIAVAGALHHRFLNAAIEGAVAILFVIVGVFFKRRDTAVRSR